MKKTSYRGRSHSREKIKQSRAQTATTASVSTLRPLGKDVPELRIVLVFIHVVDPYVTLKVVRTGIFVLPIRAEWTNITGRIVNKAMADHFIFSLETLAPLTTRTALNRTVMRARR